MCVSPHCHQPVSQQVPGDPSSAQFSRLVTMVRVSSATSGECVATVEEEELLEGYEMLGPLGVV